MYLATYFIYVQCIHKYKCNTAENRNENWEERLLGQKKNLMEEVTGAPEHG